MSPVVAAMIIVLVAVITWFIMMPYGRCLAGNWSQGTRGPPLRVTDAGWYLADVTPVTSTSAAAAAPSIAIVIKPGTRGVRLVAASNHSHVLSEGTVAYGKKSITWNSPALGASVWNKTSK